MNNVPCGLFLGEKGRMQHLRRDQRVKAACYLCCCDGCMGKDLSDIRALCNVNPCGQDCSTRWTVSCRIDCVDDAGGCVVRLAGAVALPSNPVGELLVTGRVVDFKTMAAHWGLDARKSQGETFVDTDGAFLSMWLSSKDKQAGAATSGAVSGGCDPKTKLASHDNAKLFLATLEKPDDLQGTPAPPGHSGQTGQELGGLGICAGDGGAGGAAIAPSGALPGPTMGAVPAFNFGPLPVPASVGPGPHGNAPAAEMVSAHAARHLSVASAAGPAPAPQEPAPSMPHTPGAAVADAVQGEPAADLHYGNNPVRILQVTGGCNPEGAPPASPCVCLSVVCAASQVRKPCPRSNRGGGPTGSWLTSGFCAATRKGNSHRNSRRWTTRRSKTSSSVRCGAVRARVVTQPQPATVRVPNARFMAQQ